MSVCLCPHASLFSSWCTGELSCIPSAEWDDEDAIDAAIKERFDESTAKSKIPHRHLNALAYYLAAVGLKEQEHIPLVGLSLDRRMLQMLTKVCNSDTVTALSCFACAQIHVNVKCWEKQFDVWGPSWQYQGNGACRIRYYKVYDSLWTMIRADAHIFKVNFDLDTFKARFAGDTRSCGNPFLRCSELDDEACIEWKRLLHLPGGSEKCWILCNPEVGHLCIPKNKGAAIEGENISSHNFLWFAAC